MSGTVVVTGGGSGIGEAIARAAHADGWTVGVLDRDAEAAARVASSLGSRAVALAADTASEAEVEAALDQLAAATGEAAPHGVVANAGIVRFGPLAELPVDDWRRVVDVNLTGTFVALRAAARRMLAAGTAGSLVAVTSMNGVVPGPGAGAYGATKAGIALLVQQMAVEWGPSGIRANAVAPGLVDGGMSGPIYADAEVRRLR
ncbi:MAG: SDR family NAD(P)-dependent oxidoreductase, partial [Actinobacteria bacterium]|nr:SDR family NAD(P)-dependent oxidoreductase [Actinomycetota bacterium]